MRNKLLAVLAIGLLIGTSNAHAVLIEISGTPGAGEITIDFSGSSVAEDGVVFVDDADGFVDSGWLLPSGFFANTDDTRGINLSASTATIFDGTTTYDILQFASYFSRLYVGFGIDDGTNTSFYFFSQGTTLTYSGSATAAVDIGSFTPGTYSVAGRWQGGPLEATITVATVPEPSTLALLGLGLAGIGLARRRRQA